MKKIKLSKRGILFLSFLGLILVIIVLGILLCVKSCSSSKPSNCDTTYVDTLCLEADFIELDTTLAEPVATQSKDSAAIKRLEDGASYLEKLVFADTHQRLYGLAASDFEIEASEIESGQTFSKLLNSKYNVNIAIVNELIEKSKGVFDMRDLRAGEPYTAFLKTDTLGGALQYLVYEKSRSEYIVFGTADSVFVRKGKKDVVTEERYAQGVIESSLYATMDKNGLSPMLAARLAEIFKYNIDFFAIQKGDSFRAIYEEHFIDTKSIGIGRIYGAEFIHNGKPMMAVRFEQDGEIGYWDATGKNLRRNFLAAPLSFNARVSSKFGVRIHPIKRVRRQHNGVDYAAPSGTPVHAVADGVIAAKGWDGGGGGNRIWIRHAQGLESAYLHLRGFAKGISTGSRVKQGQTIGYVGSTGASTGPHLDFRIRQKGRYIDPQKTPTTPTEPIKGGNKPAFNKMATDVKSVMSQYGKGK